MPGTPQLRITETMSGPFTLVGPAEVPVNPYQTDFFQQAAARASAAGQTMIVKLTLVARDIGELFEDLSTPMTASGTAEATCLGDKPLAITEGVFRLLVEDDPDLTVRHMRYQFSISGDGLRLFFDGFKTVEPGDFDDLWPAMTTLYTTVRADTRDGATLGLGTLRLSAAGFIRELKGIRVVGHVGERQRLSTLLQFGEKFARPLVEDFGSILEPSIRFKRSAKPRVRRKLDVPAPEVHAYQTADGCNLRLTRYQAGPRGPVVLSHGMGANPLTFSLDTIEPNLLEYLAAHQFDIWMQEWRGSTLLDSSYRSFNADDVASHDHPEAEAVVREVVGHSKVHWIGHCVGSITLLMATLDRRISPASMICLSAGAHPYGDILMKLKAGINAPGLLRWLHAKRVTSDAFDDESFGQRAIDLALRTWPIMHGERCNKQVCRRLAFIYGPAIHHHAVYDKTHDTLHELFGTANLEMLEHLGRMVKHHALCRADGQETYLADLGPLHIPITFLHGTKNGVFLPESTKRTYDLLVQEFGGAGYRRIEFPFHGHQDILVGSETNKNDSFAAILGHLDRVGA